MPFSPRACKVGYARVSSFDQKLDSQFDALAQAAYQSIGTPSPGADATRQAGGFVVLAIGDHGTPIRAFAPDTPASKRIPARRP
jgi:hypothetical protein